MRIFYTVRRLHTNQYIKLQLVYLGDSSLFLTPNAIWKICWALFKLETQSILENPRGLNHRGRLLSFSIVSPIRCTPFPKSLFSSSAELLSLLLFSTGSLIFWLNFWFFFRDYCKTLLFWRGRIKNLTLHITWLLGILIGVPGKFF